MTGIGTDTCLIYQTHPVAHAGVKTEYTDSNEKLRKCETTLKLTQSYNKFLEMNVAFMSGFPYFQNKYDVSV